MNFNENNIEDLFDSIAFKPPSKLTEFKAFYEIYKKNNYKYTFEEILNFIGVSIKKRQSFKNKMSSGFTPKELEESLRYLQSHSTEIMAILFVFQKF
jgi:hypothetical protein